MWKLVNAALTVSPVTTGLFSVDYRGIGGNNPPPGFEILLDFSAN